MPSYADLIEVLKGTAQIWIEVEQQPIDGVRLSRDYLLPDSVRTSLAQALAAIPATPVPPPIIPDENMVATDVINIRSTTNQTFPKIGTVQKGDKLVVSGTFYDKASGVDYTLIKSINGLKVTTPQYTGRKWLTPDVVTVPTPLPEPQQPSVVRRWVTASAGLKQHTLPDVSSPEGAPLVPVNTLVQVDGNSITNGYLQRVDNKLWLAAQYLTSAQPAVTPPFVPQPPISPFKTKWGLHVIWGGDYDAIVGMARDGILPGITNMKYAERSDALSNETIKTVSNGKTLILNRWYNEHDPLVYPDWNKDDLTAEGAALCQQYFGTYLIDDPDSRMADWHQLFNEPTSIGHGPGMASFWLGAMKAAESLGIRLAIGCFSERFPPLPNEVPAFWNPFFDVLRYARDHGHVYMIHGYIAPDPGGSWTNSPSMLRHRLELIPPDLHNMPTIYGEYGTAYGAEMDDDSYIAGVNAADAELMKDPGILFVSGWSAGGGGGWPRSNINGKIVRLAARAKAL